jgi:septal ring factor EnvC (AmiA/AmiB activator)
MPPVSPKTLRFLIATAMAVGVFLWEPPPARAETAVVRVDMLNVRAGPGVDHPVLGILRRGETATVVGVEGKWLKISRDGADGYVFYQPDYLDYAPAEREAEVPAPAREAIEDLRRRSEEVQEAIDERSADVARFNESEARAIETLDRLDRRINAQVLAARKLARDLKAIDRSVARQARALDDLESRIRGNEAAVGRRLVALYKMTRIGTLHLLASAPSVQEMEMRRDALERILEQDDRQRRELLRDRLAAEILAAELEDRRQEKRELEAAMRRRLASLAEERRVRSRLVADIRSRKSLALEAIEDLEASAEDLGRMMEEHVRKARAATAGRSGFSSLKGLLELPVRGKIVNLYGTYRNDRYDVVHFRNGIDIRADRGEPVRAVAGGKVLFADWFKGYGNMIIVDHGANYYTLYAHIEELFKAKGDSVEPNEVIATVGDSASLTGPGLYFEVRHHGKSENPLQWLKKG